METEAIRKITDHLGSPVNAQIFVYAHGEPGPGGARNEYAVSYFQKDGTRVSVDFQFHSGPGTDGINGITNEALMAIVGDRLRAYQSGPFSCRENAIALTKLEESLMWLNKRTVDRTARGVEGTHQK